VLTELIQGGQILHSVQLFVPLLPAVLVHPGGLPARLPTSLILCHHSLRSVIDVQASEAEVMNVHMEILDMVLYVKHAMQLESGQSDQTLGLVLMVEDSHPETFCADLDAMKIRALISVVWI
jgi:hypothetical protein